MKNWKKMSLLAGAVLLMVTGCGSKKDHGLSAKEPQEITLWHYYNGAQAIAFDELVSEFNNTVGKEKGIIVNSVSKSNIGDLTSAIISAANDEVGAEEVPDIFQCYLDMSSDLPDDVFVNLDDYVSKETKETYIDSYVEEGTFANGWRLFPVAKSSEVLVLNKTDWDKFAEATGASTEDLSTWEGMAKTAEAYYDWSDGKAFFGRDAFANYMAVGSSQLGKDVFAVDGETMTLQYDQETMRTLWDNYYVPYIKGYYTQVGRYRSDDIKLGEIVAMVCSTSSTTYFPEEVTLENGDTYPVDYQVLPLPNFEGTDALAIQQGASMAVSKSTEAREYASVLFLEWFTKPEQNVTFSLESAYLPVLKEDNSLEAIETYTTDSKTVTGIEKDTLDVAFQQIADGNLYILGRFHNANEARNFLDSSMIELAVADRTAIEEKIAGGTGEEEAESPYLTDDYFNTWFEQSKKSLEEICSK